MHFFHRTKKSHIYLNIFLLSLLTEADEMLYKLIEWSMDRFDCRAFQQRPRERGREKKTHRQMKIYYHPIFEFLSRRSYHIIFDVLCINFFLTHTIHLRDATHHSVCHTSTCSGCCAKVAFPVVTHIDTDWMRQIYVTKKTVSNTWTRTDLLCGKKNSHAIFGSAFFFWILFFN